MLRVLETAARRGARIVVINPLLESGLSAFANPQRAAGLLGHATAFHPLHVPVRINGDLALIQGIIKGVLEAEARRPGQVLDQSFIAGHCSDFDPFAAAIAATTWEHIEAVSGVNRTLIEQVAKIYCGADRVVVTWGLGITQHHNGTETIRELINLMLLRGQLGRAGSGLCPMRGHSNILGIRSMGAGERMPEGFLAALEAATGLSLSRRPGWHAVEAIQAMKAGRARALLSLGGNLAASAPDSEATAAALQDCALTVMISTKLNRSHVVPGRSAVILPCLARSEQEWIQGQEQCGLIEDMIGAVHASRGVLPPLHSELRGETRIVAEIAAELFGPASPVAWTRYATQYSDVRRLIGKVVPAYRDAPHWVEDSSRVVLPNPIRQRDFTGAGGRARFAVTALPPLPPESNRTQLPNRLRLMTIRSHDQFNTSVWGRNDRYRGIRGERRVVLLNPVDMRRLAIRPEQPVRLRPGDAQAGRQAQAFVAIAYPIPPGCAAAYFPEANSLTSLSELDRSTGTPASKSVEVLITSA